MERKSKTQVSRTLISIGILLWMGADMSRGEIATIPIKGVASQYEVIRIQIPDLGYGTSRYLLMTSVSDITNNGRVVGTYEIGEVREPLWWTKRPFVWDNGVYYEYRGPLYSDDFFGGSKRINDLNDVIVFEDPNSFEDSEKNYICLRGRPSPVSLNFIANDINNKGHIVGEEYVRIDRSDIELCPDINDYCVACGVNDGEVIVGYVKEGPASVVRRPAIWNNGQLTFLEVIEPYDAGYALQINSQNQTIGYLTKTGFRGYSNPCLWINGHVTMLYPLRKVYAINDHGRIVGADEEKKALLWDDGEVIDLNSLISTDPNDPSDWDRLNKAVGINNDDWIIGYGYLNEDRNRILRREHAFLARPKQPANADIDNNGVVDFRDYSILAAQWLEEKQLK